MSIATTRADRIGLTISLLLAGVLAVVLLTGFDNDATSSTLRVDAAQTAAGDLLSNASHADTPVATTVALSVPVPAAASSPVALLDIPKAETVTPLSGDASENDAPTAPADDADNEPDATTATESAIVIDEETASTTGPAVGASTAPDASSAQAAAPEVPNPQPQATAVPNPQPQATEVPNPQPQATAVPNPQRAVAADVPADAPAGGTFTHTLSATVARPTLHTEPGGPIFTPTFNGTALPAVNPTVFGNTLVYRVLAGQPGDAWAKVYVPARPNGTTAWVQTSQFNWGSSNRLLQISVSNRTVTVYEGSNVLLSTSAVLGSGVSPTPLADGWVEETMAGPSAAYGPTLISLGIFSDALNSFAGGIPKIALHGTNNPGLMGQYASNGCIRVPNEIITQVASLMPPGSKVQIIG